jgi:hypothetical protein
VLRDDLSVPILVFETETDVAFSNNTVTQADTPLYRLWEVAGTSHFDYYGLVIGNIDIGDGQGAVLALESMQHPVAAAIPGVVECTLPINTGPMHWVLDAAVYWVNVWVQDGTPPPIAPRFQISSVSPVVYATDANGNTLGGIRTPQVNAPVAKLAGTGNPVVMGNPLTTFCGLFGLTIPFTPADLAALYKNHGQFVSDWGHAARDGVKAGFLLQSDSIELLNAASKSQIGK